MVSPTICASAAHTPLDENHTDEIDNDSIILSPEPAQRIDQFRNEIHLCKTDRQRYEICVRTRNELLKKHTGVQLLVVACEYVMFIECTSYKDWKETVGKSTIKETRPDENDTAEWGRFLTVAKERHDIKSKCAAAREVREWGRAVSGLNLSILERSQQGMLLKRRPVLHTINPIEPKDLEYLCKHPPDKPLDIILPTRLGFDKFGLIAHEQYAVPGLSISTEYHNSMVPSQPGSDAITYSETTALPEGATNNGNADQNSSDNAHPHNTITETTERVVGDILNNAGSAAGTSPGDPNGLSNFAALHL